MNSLLDSFPTEKVSLYKRNGEIVEEIKALVGSNKFNIDDLSANIEEGDFFIRSLPNGSKEYYCVIDRGFYKGGGGIPDHYQSKVSKVSKEEMEHSLKKGNTKGEELEKTGKRVNKLFISHSSKDGQYVKAFVELLEDIGISEGSIICTSVPGYGVPGGTKIYDWLREQFVTCRIRVIFALSKNYYDSPASLNEMGAAWVTKAADTILLLPGFEFADIRGCIDPREIGIKLDGDEEELKHRLNELKDTLIEEYSLLGLSETKWERYRNRFISSIRDIEKADADKESERSSDKEGDEYVPVDTISEDMPESIPTAACFLLVYASTDSSGEIRRTRSIIGTAIGTAGKEFIIEDSPREIARWEEALDYLVLKGWVKRTGTKGQIFKITHQGYMIADRINEDLGINTNNDPHEELQKLEG